jgi:hypothetical protein
MDKERKTDTEKYIIICHIIFDLGIHLAGDKISTGCSGSSCIGRISILFSVLPIITILPANVIKPEIHPQRAWIHGPFRDFVVWN